MNIRKHEICTKDGKPCKSWSRYCHHYHRIEKHKNSACLWNSFNPYHL